VVLEVEEVVASEVVVEEEEEELVVGDFVKCWKYQRIVCAEVVVLEVDTFQE